MLSLLDEFFHDNRVSSLRRAECSEVNQTYLYENGLWVEVNPDIEGVYRRCV